VLMMAAEPRLRQSIMNGLTSPWFFESFLMIGSTLIFGLYLSVRMRHGGMLVAILSLWFLGPITVGLLFSTLNISVNTLQMDRSAEVTGHILLILVQMAFCVWMYRLLIRRLNDLGAVC